MQLHGARTILKTVDHFGPLRVQRPFYPEGDVCHVYLLHPPGGMVGGDSLAIAINLATGAHSLVTTPAAGKLYRVADGVQPQYQGVRARVADGAVLEWMPQETIVFNGARGELLNRFELEGSAQCFGWDIVCLGRRASGESFDTGQLLQKIEIYRGAKPVFLDRVRFDGGSAMLAQPWGMNGKTVSGTLFATAPAGQAFDRDSLRSALSTDSQWGLTVRQTMSTLAPDATPCSGEQMLLVRYLGDSAERCRQGFERIWQQLRPQLMSRPAHRPRIWNT